MPSSTSVVAIYLSVQTVSEHWPISTQALPNGCVQRRPESRAFSRHCQLSAFSLQHLQHRLQQHEPRTWGSTWMVTIGMFPVVCSKYITRRRPPLLQRGAAVARAAVAAALPMCPHLSAAGITAAALLNTGTCLERCDVTHWLMMELMEWEVHFSRTGDIAYVIRLLALLAAAVF